ncbi:MAG: HTH domain-containing protein [Candidatus Diapherotrites archaeon]|nr:HTH domain-containing protein [Candidatus Diapherotrites archaeon]
MDSGERRKLLRARILGDELFTTSDIMKELGVARSTLKGDLRAVMDEPEVRNKLDEIRWEPGTTLHKAMLKHRIREEILSNPGEYRRKPRKRLSENLGVAQHKIDEALQDLAEEEEFRAAYSRVSGPNKEARKAAVRKRFDDKQPFTAYNIADELGVHRSTVERDISEVIREDDLDEDPTKLGLYISQRTQKFLKKQEIARIVKEAAHEIEGSFRQHVMERLGLGYSVFYEYIRELCDSDEDFSGAYNDLTKPEYERRRDKLLEELIKGKTTHERLRAATGTCESTLKKDLQRLKGDRITALFAEGKIVHPKIMEKEERKQDMYEHVIRTRPAEHPAYGENPINFYMEYLGVESPTTIYSYLSELLAHRRFREAYFKLFEPGLEANKKAVAARMVNDPEALLRADPVYRRASKGAFSKAANNLRTMKQRDAINVLSKITKAVKDSRDAEEERGRIYEIHVTHGISPLVSTILARALGLPQRTQDAIIKDRKKQGYRNNDEVSRYAMKRWKLRKATR